MVPHAEREAYDVGRQAQQLSPPLVGGFFLVHQVFKEQPRPPPGSVRICGMVVFRSAKERPFAGAKGDKFGHYRQPGATARVEPRIVAYCTLLSQRILSRPREIEAYWQRQLAYGQ